MRFVDRSEVNRKDVDISNLLLQVSQEMVIKRKDRNLFRLLKLFSVFFYRIT